MEYIKCDKCNAAVKTQGEFKDKLKTGVWFIGREDLHWTYMHKCK